MGFEERIADSNKFVERVIRTQEMVVEHHSKQAVIKQLAANQGNRGFKELLAEASQTLGRTPNSLLRQIGIMNAKRRPKTKQ